MSSDLKSHLLRRFELYVAVLTLGFVGMSGALLTMRAPAVVVFAATTLGMALITGTIQWADRERQKRLRAQAIDEIREMLMDQVLNQLAAMRMWMAEGDDPEALEIMFHETSESIDRVATMINGLSEAQLDTWRLTYANVADSVIFPEAATA